MAIPGRILHSMYADCMQIVHTVLSKRTGNSRQKTSKTSPQQGPERFGQVGSMNPPYLRPA